MKTVLITGSSSGIGLGIAKAFAKAKYDVVIHGFHNDGNALAEQLSKEFGVRCYFNDSNLAKAQGVRDLIAFGYEKLGDIDVLVNNAGIQHVSPIESFSDEKWDEIIAVNLSAVFHAKKAVFTKMKEKKKGRIINVASVHGLVASEFKSAYVTSKHGVIGLTKTVALEGAPFGITCNVICPGYVKTPLVDGQIKDQAKAHGITEDEVVKKVLLVKHAIKDFISIESIASLCLYLASDEASSITGSTFTLDGGWTAQ